jgi:hypothetical protein
MEVVGPRCRREAVVLDALVEYLLPQHAAGDIHRRGGMHELHAARLRERAHVQHQPALCHGLPVPLGGHGEVRPQRRRTPGRTVRCSGRRRLMACADRRARRGDWIWVGLEG